jgi:hypothetical protein
MNLARRNPEAYATLVDSGKKLRWTNVFQQKEGSPVSEQELLDKFPKLDLS